MRFFSKPYDTSDKYASVFRDDCGELHKLSSNPGVAFGTFVFNGF